MRTSTNGTAINSVRINSRVWSQNTSNRDAMMGLIPFPPGINKEISMGIMKTPMETSNE